MSYYTLLLCIVLHVPSLAQTYFSVDIRKEGDISYPLFSNDSNLIAATRINEFLGLTELAILPQKHKDIFKEITSKDAMGGLYGRKVIVGHTIHTNSKQALSLEIYNAASGMTMHYWKAFYTFNPLNGDRIDLQDLFTRSGWKQFEKLSKKKRRKEIAWLKKEVEYLNNEFFQAYLDDDYSSFFIADGKIYHNGFNLYPKGLADDLLTEFSFKEVSPMLNDYGRAVLGPATDSVGYFRSNNRPQLMKGQVGTYPITFILGAGVFTKDYSQIDGVYAYDKYGTGISVFGFPDTKSHVIMDEMTCDSCQISIHFTQTSIKGHWINKEKKQRLSLWAKKEE